ncbi:MAG: hypothetical protein ABI860_08695 [Gemmatimonadales bacterium]
MADDRAALRREVLTLLGLVLLVDGVFIAIYYAAGLRAGGGGGTLGYTALWTVVTLAVVLRSLGRIRVLRVRLRQGGREGAEKSR